MNASLPVRIIADAQADRMADGCDLCCAIPAVTELDGDQMCQSCADKWVRAQAPDDDLMPLDHPVMREAIARWKALSDDQLKAHSKQHRKFNREERRAGGRS